MTISLQDPVQVLPGIGPARAARLEKLGLRRDVLVSQGLRGPAADVHRG